MDAALPIAPNSLQFLFPVLVRLSAAVLTEFPRDGEKPNTWHTIPLFVDYYRGQEWPPFPLFILVDFVERSGKSLRSIRSKFQIVDGPFAFCHLN